MQEIQRKSYWTLQERTLQRLDAYSRIKKHYASRRRYIAYRNEILGSLQKASHLSAGSRKACNHMAMAVDEILGDRLTRGIAIVKISEETDHFHNTEVYVGGHPLPNQAGYEAWPEILDLVDHAGRRIYSLSSSAAEVPR